MAPNPAARVVMRLTREGPEAALEELAAEAWDSSTFATTGRKLPAEQVERELAAVGLPVVGRYAARVANDYLTDDALKGRPRLLRRAGAARAGPVRPGAVPPAGRDVAAGRSTACDRALAS
jgi:S-adenosylmethionine-dependent methyltransferase